MTSSSSTSSLAVADVCLSSPAGAAHFQSSSSASPARMGVAWGVGNRLMAFPTRDRRLNKGQNATAPTDMHEVTWETTLYQPVFRKLVNESWQTFRALQSASASEEDSSASSYLVNFSRQYRSIIRDCQEQLDALHDTDPAAAQHSELLYKLELVWNLVEIICIEKQTSENRVTCIITICFFSNNPPFSPSRHHPSPVAAVGVSALPPGG